MTERRTAAADRQLNLMFDASPDLVCTTDEGGFFIRLNPAWTRVLGWSEAELLARSFLDLVHPDDRGPAAAAYADVYATGHGNYQYESRVQTKDGMWRWLQWSSNLMPEVGLVMAAARDVTVQRAQGEELERSNAQLARLTETLSESEKRFQVAWDNAPIGKARVALEGQFLQVNPALCTLLQRSAEELLTLRFHDIVPTDDIELDRALMGRLFDDEIKSSETERRYLRPDGSTGWILLGVSLVRDDRDEPEYFIAQMLDIDERKRHETALAREISTREAAEADARRERDISWALLAAMSDGYCYTSDGVIVDVNDRLCALTGFDRHELIGHPRPYPFWPLENLAEMRARVAADTAAQGIDMEAVFVRKDGGQFPVALSARAARNAEGKPIGFVTTARDISTYKRREDALVDMASRDPLTGLLNRRAADEHIGQLKAGDAVLALDLDHFKRVNDEHGHAGGDDVLRALAKVVDSTLRSQDWAARVGGEEFLIVLPDTSQAEAAGVAARLHDAWGATEPRTTYSVGIALHHEGDEPVQTIAWADRALYRAKRNGRNRIEIFARD